MLELAYTNPKIRLKRAETDEAAIIELGTDVAMIGCWSAASEGRYLYVANKNYTENVANTVRLVENYIQNGTVSGKSHLIYGSHNKPDGTYNGTGATRKVSVGGSGTAVLVRGNKMICLATPMGSLVNNAGETFVFSSNANFNGSELSFIGTLMNEVGTTYSYQLL